MVTSFRLRVQSGRKALIVSGFRTFAFLVAVPVACLAGELATSGQTGRRPAPRQEPKKASNFVTELLNVDLRDTRHRVWEFVNPRDGWVFLTVPGMGRNGGVRAWVALDGAPREQAVLAPGDGGDGEAMRHLIRGVHRVEVWAEGGTAGALAVRAIPEIIFLRFTGDFHSPDGSPYKPSHRSVHGADRLFLYYWDWLDKHILKNVNVIQGGSRDHPFMRQWLACGRKVIAGGHFSSQDPEELQAQWSRGLREPFHGVIIDEFVPPTGDISRRDSKLGGYRPGLGFDPEYMELITRLHGNPQLAGTLYAYLGMPWNAKAENCRMLIETLMACDYKWVWEAYLWEQPSERDAVTYIESAFRQRMLDFREAFPGAEANCVVCPSILEAWDSFPNMDFKVWLDMQFRMMATEPAFDGICGVIADQSTTADPELVCWLSRLLRHYCIQGHTGLVSPEYGYSLILRHLENPGLADGGAGWTISQAEPGSVRVVRASELPIKKGYLPKADNVLVMTRSAVKPNLVSQDIRALTPGHLFSLRMYSCDLGDLATRKKHVQSVKLGAVTVLEERSLQDIQQGDGAGANTACWNYTYRVFRAITENGRIEISDWADATTPGAPIGQETLFCFFQVQPLFQPDG